MLATASLMLLALLPSAALADRSYFLRTYSPYVDEAGENEVSLWLTSKSGWQDPSEAATLVPRAEWEHAVSSRLTGAAFINFLRPAGASLTLESASLAAVYQLSAPGRFAVDPAAYVQVTGLGDELEVYANLLFARHTNRWLGAVNLISEFAFRNDQDEHGANGTVLKNSAAMEITGGLAYGVGRPLAIGFEGRARSEYANFGGQSATLIAIGPSLNLQLGETQLSLGALRQISGTPRTSDVLNLVNFERTELRVVIALGL